MLLASGATAGLSFAKMVVVTKVRASVSGPSVLNNIFLTSKHGC